MIAPTSLVSNLRYRLGSWLLQPYRSRPGQKHESPHYMQAAGPNATDNLIWYALNVWVYSAVSKLAATAAAAPLQVLSGTQQNENHPLLDLIGLRGAPNAYQDVFNFWENHYSHMLLDGNAFWYFTGAMQPEEVHLLDPRNVELVPGKSDLVGEYRYRVMGHQIAISPENIVHFKRPNPFSPYYGLSAMEALRVEVNSDRSMALWNEEFFDGPAQPSGIMVIPPHVSPRERDRVEQALNLKFRGRRRTAVIQADPKATVWHEAGLKHHELDFESGRMLSRKAVYEALELPVGLMSEASTEAHARVAERQFRQAVYQQHLRTASRAQIMLRWYPDWSRYILRFEDVRVADMEQLERRTKARSPYWMVDELRAEDGLPPLPNGEGQRLIKGGGNAANMFADGASDRLPADSGE